MDVCETEIESMDDRKKAWLLLLGETPGPMVLAEGLIVVAAVTIRCIAAISEKMRPRLELSGIYCYDNIQVT
jgi:hypothetical protein